MKSTVRGALCGAGVGSTIATIHALGWYAYFATGPTPRDFASASAFAARMFPIIEALGLILAVPAGLALGAAAIAGRGQRKSVGLAIAPFVFSGLEAASWRIASFWSVAIPALVLAAMSGAIVAKLVKGAQEQGPPPNH